MSVIAHNVITLKSKLAPPRLTDTIARQRLYPLLEGVENAKAVTVTAGAGYGKTIFAAQACRSMRLPAVWYRLDSSDGDAIVFINYLIAGLRRFYPAFGTRSLANVQTVEQFGSERQEIWTPLLHEMETTIHEPLVFILDDFHLVDDIPEIRSGMAFMLEHLPEQVHFIIISRTRPQLDLSRLIAARQAYGISAKELTFDRGEIEQLYTGAFNITLPDDVLDVLAQKTGGWAVGLILFHYALKGKGLLPKDIKDIHSQLSLLNGNYQVFSDYLEENLFKTLSDEIGLFLLRTSILPVLDVQFCNRLLKITNAKAILDELEKMHLFTSALDDDGWIFQYHHLFRDYLRAKLKKYCDAPTVAELHLRAAKLFEDQNDVQEAIEHYLAAEAYDAAAALMGDHGEELIEAGLFNQIMVQCEQLPQQCLDAEPRIKVFLGLALFLKGKTRESLVVLETTRRQFMQRQNDEAERRCTTLLGLIYCVLNDFSKAEDTFKSLIDRQDITSDIYALSLGNLIFISSRVYNLEQVEFYFEKAASLLESNENPQWNVLIYVSYGFGRLAGEAFNDAIHYGRRAEKEAKRLKRYNLVTLCCHLISAAWLELGEFEKGYQKALEGIRLSETLGFRGSIYAWCLIDAAFCAAGSGRDSEVLDFGRKSLAVSEEVDSGWTSAYAYIAIAVAHIREADFNRAEMCCRQALNAIKHTALVKDKAFIQSHLAWVLLAQNRLDEAMAFTQAVEKLRLPSKLINRWILLFYCCLDAIQEKLDSAKDKLKRVLADTPEGGKDRLLQGHQQWITPLLVDIYADGHCRERIEALLPTFSPESVEAIKCHQYSDSEKGRSAVKTLTNLLNLTRPQDLRVYSFGLFRLYKGDAEIETQQWTSSKARLLFKYLAFYSRHGYVVKDKLLEMLWPDQDPAVTNKRLHVALTTIRKMLEPDLPRGARSVYLLRNNESYRLELGGHGYSDVAAFDAAIDAAAQTIDPQQAIVKMTEAESLYKGEFLAEEPYTPWCAEVRQIYKEKYLSVLLKLADHSQDMRAFDKAIDYLQRFVAIDAYIEEIYFRLMRLYQETGNRVMAVKTYEQCRYRLQTGLDVAPSDGTEQLYRQILSM